MSLVDTPIPASAATPGVTQYVLGFAFASDLLEVLLIRKLRPAWQRGLFNGLGGKVEPGETPRQAMTREFREECGLEVSDWRDIGVLTGVGFCVHLFSAIAEIDKARTQTDEAVYCWDVQKVARCRTEMIGNLPTIIFHALDLDAPKLVLAYREHRAPVEALVASLAAEGKA